MGIKDSKITFLDTTLRDGEQAPGNSMSYNEKLELALLLENAGIETIETGFPASSNDDFISTKKISEALTTSKFATFSRTKIEDIDLAIKAGGVSDKHVLMLVATGSDLHLEKKRNMSREEGIEEIKKVVKYASKKGMKNIAVGIEDASRASKEYMKEIVDISLECGANQIILADTTGYSMPEDMYNLTKFIKKCVGNKAKVSVHCHNDLGLAVINSYMAILGGADEIQGTIGGIGERAGNTSIEQVIALINYKGREANIYNGIKQNDLYKIYKRLSEIIGLEENRAQPLFGKYVFSTSAGIHQQGIINDPKTYEFVSAEDWGRNRNFYVDKHSGKSILRKIFTEQQYNNDISEKLQYMYEKYIENSKGTIKYEDLVYKVKSELEGDLTYG